MSEKLSIEQITTIPIEIRRLLNVKAGESISFNVNDDGITVKKSKRPLIIQERFTSYDISPSNEESKESMKEIDTGKDVGEEQG